MRAGVSLVIRAVCAVVLMVLFYVLAVAMAAALIAFGVLLLLALPRVHGGQVMLLMIVAACGCFVAAAVIVWSVVPRFDRFEPPGPQVKPGEHPSLFAEIRAVAAATGERMPRHVYLTYDMNAFVAQRGGFMGLGSRRVMGLGLPLLRTLQVDELRAVLAHEMGHFYGGDTRLGPWIHKTRGGLARTVINLARLAQIRHATDHWISGLAFVFAAVQAPFRWFLSGFLRVSQAISRAQEYSADAVAVRAEGKRAVIDGLKKVHAAAIAHAIYLRSEVMPLVHRGALPAVGDGFSRFLATPGFAQLLERSVADELDARRANPYDSHPPLGARIAAAQAIDGPERPADRRRGIDLIEGAERIETDGLASCVGRKLERVSWDDAAPLWIASWREQVQRAQPMLVELRVDELSSDFDQVYRLAARLLGERAASAADAQGLEGWWLTTAGAALAVMLLDAGFTVTARVGEPFRFTRGDLANDGMIEPFGELRALLDNQCSAGAWRARWTERGFAGHKLAGSTRPGAPAE